VNGNILDSVEYTYDVYDRRIGKSVDSDGDGNADLEERFVLDGDEITLVFDGQGNLIERFLHGVMVDQVLAQENGDGSVYLALADNQGSIRYVLDNSGNVINEIIYNSFGEVTSESNPSVDFRFGYTGRELDEETGLYYYRSRYYDSTVGRFISEDAIGFEGGDANLYRYVINSPVNYTDPYGEKIDWYNIVDKTDEFFAGFGDAVSFGGTTLLRNKLYGDLATNNHEGGFFTTGQITGALTSFALGYNAETNLVKLSPWLLKSIRAYDALGTIIDGYNSLKNIVTGCADWTDFLGFAPALGGASYWKQFDFPEGISFKPNIKKHLIYGEGLQRPKNAGILGAHNLDNFNQEVINHNLNILSRRYSPDIKGLQDVKYQMPDLNKQLQWTGNYRVPIRNPKTLYDPKFIPDNLVLDLGQKAAAKGLKDPKNLAKREFNETVGGLTFQIYKTPGTKNITNFHPQL
jgi:RHS repeat-associated protein